MIYSEEQRFNQKWVRFILWSITILCIIISALVIIQGKANYIVGLLPSIFSIMLLILFSKIKLEIMINENMLEYKFKPFLHRIITRDKIKRVSVVDYDPISEYGGWGIRYGKKGWAYTVKGVHGIKIITSLGKTILIGTSKPLEVSEFLQKYYSGVFNNNEITK